METRQAIETRASVRAFKPEPVERQVLEQLVDAGRRAPSARAVEPWEFVVVTNRECLLKLSVLAKNGSFLKQAPAAVIVFSQDTPYYLEDGCAATENILLAAADAGLGACWIAGDKKPYAAQVAQLVKAPASLKLISILALGWPAEPGQQKKARALAEVLHWETFD